ncbi:hypothetical protein GCM10010249_08050 [Streptomyces roseolilacinus]|uniref:DUF7674 domain-containing protein n=2 Tax=Streptomyces roseolilacinus TaxID=66904 RepID=A0A918EIW6_9ACTN|nr:hypothetical protein GCM10010249_08050 [Streptomyces roseolilacinus]
MEMNEEQFFHGLLQDFPQLEGLHAEHVEFYEEFLSHVFLADVVRWAVSLFSEAGQGSTGEAIGLRLINFIEDAYVHGDCAVRELIRVSFVENLPYSGQGGFRIHEHLTGNLRRIFGER